MAMDINYHPSNNGDINLQHMGASTNPPSKNLGLQHFQVVSEVAPQLFQAGTKDAMGCGCGSHGNHSTGHAENGGLNQHEIC